jgi:hypothetical protein
MKGSLSPEEFSKFQNTQGIKAVGDALPTQSNVLLNNPAMNARIQGATAAAPYTGLGQYAQSPINTGVGPIANAAKPLPTAFEAASARMPYSPGSVAAEPFNMGSSFNSLNPTSQSRINNAIGAVSHEGQPLVATAENRAAISAATKPHVPGQIAAEGATGGYFSNLKNAVTGALSNPAQTLRNVGTYAMEHPYEVAKGVGRGAAGLAIGAANAVLPKFNEDSYLGQAANNLRDTAANIGGGLAMGGPLGGVIGGAIDLGEKAYGVGKEAYNYVKGGIDSRNAIADSNRTMEERKAQMSASPSLPPGLTVTPNAGIMNGLETLKPTAQSQITPLNGISNGMPVAPGIVNNPAPVGQPAAAPEAPYNPGAVSRGGADWDARFKKDTSTRYNSGSDMDRLNMQRLQSGQSTLDARQYRQYINDGGARTPQVQAGGSSIPPRSEDQTDSERRAQLGKSMGLNGPYKGSMVDGMPSKQGAETPAQIRAMSTQDLIAHSKKQNEETRRLLANTSGR